MVMVINFIKAFLAFIFIFTSSYAFGEEYVLPTIQIFGNEEQAFDEPGSIYTLDEKNLEQRQALNPHEVLKEVPGVIIQEEDGLGLRPNIGLRGAHPHRSRKVTLMEDGVLIAPAPYSAPAAYYFPLFSKITGVEVYKGPSSIKYGPYSVGGAINFLTRDFKKKQETSLHYSFGSFNTHKLQAWSAGSVNGFDWLLEGNRWTSDGFKDLPGGGDTSFYRNDIMFKGRYKFKTKKERALGFKLGWSNEESNETYLGIIKSDFLRNHLQRYEASRTDVLDWRHFQARVDYVHEWSDHIFSEMTLYRHNFNRNWNKLNGFVDPAVSMRDVLNAPDQGQNPDFLEVLKGQKDSTASEELQFGINDREYYSQGLNIENELLLNENLSFDLGLLFHQDQIERKHKLQNAQMTSGRLVKGSPFIEVNNNNIDTSRAFRTFLMFNADYEKVLFRIGSRFERVLAQRENKINGAITKRDESVFVPGFGFTYRANKFNNFFVGVNKGVTLPGPGQASQIDPEESISYELGYRFRGRGLNLDLVGFYNDYSNILGTCTFSAGCTTDQLDVQFNGGEAKISGVEFLLSTDFRIKSVDIPVTLSATYTSAEFSNSFESENKEWGEGDVFSGDPLPYVPDLTTSLALGLNYKKWSNQLVYAWKSSVFDQSVSSNRLEIDAYGTLNITSTYNLNKKASVYLKVDNVFDEVYVSSLRPFGARPGAPRWVSLGLNYSF